MNETEFLGRNVEKDINLDDLYSALVECFSVILCGYAAGRLKLISPRETKGLDVFVRIFSLPSVIFLSLAQLDMSSVNWKFLASIFLAKSVVFVGVLAVTVCLSRPIIFGKLGLFAVFCTQSNDFALGYTILNALYGKEHPSYPSYVYLLAPISLAVLNPIGFILLEIGKYKQERETLGDSKNLTEGDESNLQISQIQGTNEDNKTREDSINENTVGINGDAPKPSSENITQDRKSLLKLCGKVFLNIATNPVMLMTVLGISANFLYSYIEFVGVILKAFATVFSTSALFLLGLRMVGSVHKLKGNALITPGILIITKLLVLPLVTREIVSLLKPGINANDTLDLSTFGFMYGTFPTAPMVFVFATQYELEVESISSALVVCTFLSGPLMYISARMIFNDFLPPDDYNKKLESLEFNIGILGILFGAWLLILFAVNKSFNKIPHKITGFLIISQIILCLGMVLQPLTEHFKPWFPYVQLSILAFGLYSTRLWTCFLAIALVVLQSRSLCFVIKLMRVFLCVGWGLPLILTIVACFVSYTEHPFRSLINPSFKHGMFQPIVTLVLLSVSLVGTIVCLILQHRYQRRFAKYLVLVQEINSKDLNEVNETNIGESSSSGENSLSNGKNHIVRDIEEIVSATDDLCTGNCEQEGGLCSSKFSCTETEREKCEETIRQYNEVAVNEELDEVQEDRQILRHIVLLLFLVTAMFVNLMLSIWTLVVEDAISGVYFELLFLNMMLNTGQVCLTFAVFGFDSKILFVSLTNRWRKFYYGADTIVLTPVDQLGFETTHVCHQFIAHHLEDCEKEIAKTKRLRLRMYKYCFKGKVLVSWLKTKHLAKDEMEAVQYASHLLEGRVLRHVENRHHFENSDLLYTFRQ